MYRVLIVDDQYFALLGLQQGVDWSALSVSDVCLAENVDQAIAVLEQQPVDLLICDIEMPGRSGLELLAWVKQSAPGTLTIMLTCHADFEYAQRAIYHGAFHYLLKPVDYEELMKISREALFEISKQREQQQFEALIQKYRRQWEHQLPCWWNGSGRIFSASGQRPCWNRSPFRRTPIIWICSLETATSSPCWAGAVEGEP